jgi:NTE family protein
MLMPSERRQALVLSGGSIKGAYQAGAIQEIFKPHSGFRPTAIYGVSVGAINGAFLANEVGQQIRDGKPPDLAIAGEKLATYWGENIGDFSKLGRKVGPIRLLWDIFVKKKFNGTLKMEQLYELLGELAKPENLKLAATQGDLKFYAGALNLSTGLYFDAPESDPKILDYVIASTAMPVVMPMRQIKELKKAEKTGWWLDGGIHNVAPLSAAINEKYNDIVCVACRPEKIGSGEFPGLVALGERLSDVIAQRLLDHDLEWAQKINNWIDEGIAPARYREVWVTVVRPQGELPFDIVKFERGDIDRMIEQGRRDAGEQMQKHSQNDPTVKPGKPSRKPERQMAQAD